MSLGQSSLYGGNIVDGSTSCYPDPDIGTKIGWMRALLGIRPKGPHDSRQGNLVYIQRRLHLPMACSHKTRLLVHVADWTQVTAHNFEVCVLSNVVLCHLEHAQVKVGNWAEGPAGHQNYGGLLWISDDAGEALMRKRIVRGVGKVAGNTAWRIHGREREEKL